MPNGLGLVAPLEYTIQNRSVKLPVQVRDAASISAAFVVPTAAVRELIDLPELRPAELLPGRTLCTIVGIEYRENDLGTYNEVGVVFFVGGGERRRLPILGTALDLFRGRLGAYVHQLPVTTSFSTEAGREIWGFPKFVAEISFGEESGRRVCALSAQGHHVLTLSVRPGRRGRSYPDAQLSAYSGLNGVARRTKFSTSGEGASFRLGGAVLELGTHPIADELRGLGLPRRALTSACVEHMTMRFEAPEPL